MFNLVATLVVITSVSGTPSNPTRLGTTSVRECVTALSMVKAINGTNRENNTRVSYDAYCELRAVETEGNDE